MATVYFVGDNDDMRRMDDDEIIEQSHEFYHQVEDAVEDMLNELYETVEICGVTFDAGSAFRKLDPIAFSCMVSEQVVEVDTDNPRGL